MRLFEALFHHRAAVGLVVIAAAACGRVDTSGVATETSSGGQPGAVGGVPVPSDGVSGSRATGGGGGVPAMGGSPTGASGGTPDDIVEPECLETSDCAGQDDGDHCNGTLRCEDGYCVLDVATVVSCAELVPSECQVFECTPTTGACEEVPTSGGACAENDFCALSGTCVDGVCETTPRCDANCETCDANAQLCVLDENWCRIAGMCVPGGQFKEPDGCLLCDPTTSEAWSPALEGTPCELEDDTCFVDYQCGPAGTCLGLTPIVPLTPTIRGPASGTRSGSLHAPGTLRPKFVWDAAWTQGCSPPTFDIQIDDSCDPENFRNCSFESPEAVAHGLVESEFVTPTDLPVSTTVPVGRRYYWRVRACRQTQCSAWSAVHYHDVGRAKQDLNGDGYSDFFVAGFNRAGYVYLGSPAGIEPTDHRELPHAIEFGTFGDVDGDFFDEVIGTAYQVMYVIRGTSSGLGAVHAHTRYGSFPPQVASGDFNADGYDDIFVGRGISPVMGDLFGGSSSGVPLTFTPVPWPSLGTTADPARMRVGDFNGDGILDLAIATLPLEEILIHLGSFSGLASRFGSSIAGLSTDTSSSLKFSVGDTNDDFRDDIYVAFNRLYLYRAAASTFGTSPTATWIDYDQVHVSGESAAGRLTGNDTRADVVFGAPAAFFGGKVVVFSANGFPSGARYDIPNPSGAGSYVFGRYLAVPGDVNGDGIDDLVLGNTGYGGRGAAHVYYGPIESSGRAPDVTLAPPSDLINSYGMRVF